MSGAGGGFETEATYSPELSLWYAVQWQDKRCWNGFDIGEPLGGKKVSVTAEVSFPAEGLNCAVLGVFAEDGKDGLWVLHRGKIRGGRELFFRYLGGETTVTDNGGREDTFALIGKLDDADFAAKLTAFVSEVLWTKVTAKG